MDNRRYVIPNLSAIRSQRGVSMQSIVDSTRIRLFYLEAIENGEFGKLPGLPYARSYIRQYALAIDFDPSELLRALPPEEETGSPNSLAAPPNFWRRLLRIASSVLPHGTANPRRT
jgi:cytoskeletal protein RodZ